MRKQKNHKRNHWTQSKVDNATKKINQDIYEKSRQVPIYIKLDDLSVYINDRMVFAFFYYIYAKAEVVLCAAFVCFV